MRAIRSCKIWWNFARIRPSWQNNWPPIFRVNTRMYGLFPIFTPNYLCFFQTTVRWRSIHLVPIILAAWRHVQSNWLFSHTPVSHSNYDCNILRWNGPFNYPSGSFQVFLAWKLFNTVLKLLWKYMYYDFKSRRIAQGADLDGSTLLPSIAGSATLIYVGGGGGSVFKLMGQNKARHRIFKISLYRWSTYWIKNLKQSFMCPKIGSISRVYYWSTIDSLLSWFQIAPNHYELQAGKNWGCVLLDLLASGDCQFRLCIFGKR